MQWISVKDRYPNENEHVLVYDKIDGICRGYFCFGSWQHFPIGSFAVNGFLFHVTHWMPLPDAPKE